jgi:hypothetical protein
MEGGIDDWEEGGGSGTELVGGSGSSVFSSGAETVGSSEEFREESSGFAIRRPPKDWERLRSPSIMGEHRNRVRVGG